MIRHILCNLLILLCVPHIAFAFPFTLVKKETDTTSPVLLMAAGIHGDEPAAFLAAGLFINHYTIKKGRVWTVPNLNFQSILHTSRGIAGDMNRKFKGTHKNDPDYVNLESIKALIKNPDVTFVYSMHDGSGFYREKHYSNLYSPYRWGQCVIIDQATIDPAIPHYNLNDIATKLVDAINTKLISKNEKYRVRNTNTKDGNAAMELSLTWFSVQNGKASISVEASKNIPLARGVYYHLVALEHILNEKGIVFERDFELTPQGVQKALYDINVKLFQSYELPLQSLRKQLRFIPFPSSEIQFTTSNPLLYIYRKKNAYIVQYGNKILTTLHPEFIPFDTTLSFIPITVDNTTIDIPMGTVFDVKESFSVPAIEGYRLNIIGYVNPQYNNEFDCTVARETISSHYSIDTTKRIYRIELYKDDAFAGLVYARFPIKNKTK